MMRQFNTLRAASTTAAVGLAVLAGTAGARADIVGFSGFAPVNSVAPATNTIGYSADGTTFTINDGQASEAVSGFYSVPQAVSAGFTTSFIYTAPSGNNSGTQYAQGDGFNFVLQNDARGTAALGGNGGDKGYGNSNGGTAIGNSAALSYEIYGSDTDRLLFNGAAQGTNTTSTPINSGGPVRITLTYTGSTLNESLYSVKNNATYLRTYNNVTLNSVVGATALVGFTGGTGGASINQQVSGFTFRATRGATYTPVVLTTASFNQDGVVEAGATAPLAAVSATMDGGTSKGGATWYEVGANAAAPTTGLPASGTIATSQNDGAHTFQLQSYAGNNVALLDVASPTDTLGFVTPTALNALSLLMSAGNGPAPITLTIHHAGGAADETVTGVASPDWFFQNAGAFTAGGRANVNNATNPYETDGTNPKLYQVDVPLGDSTDPITSVDLAYTGTNVNTQVMVFGLSGVASSAVPEPASLGLLATGVVGLLARRRRTA